VPTILKGKEVAGSGITRTSSCYRVLMRNLVPGPRLNKWEVISTSGYAIVCPSKMEACLLVWFVGGRYYPRPDYLNGPDEKDDLRYLDWLLKHHFRLERHVPTRDAFLGVCKKTMEVSFALALRGWVPSLEDVPMGPDFPGVELVRDQLESRWQGL
jgi:hypothetical protein